MGAKRFWLVVGVWVVVLGMGVSAVGPDAPPPPEPRNFLILLADDLGVDGIGAYGVGSDLPSTPNVDGLAATGVLFRNAWANPVCTPSRASLQTGLHASRVGLGGSPTNGFALGLEYLTIAEALRMIGYSTGGFGKWHLGNDSVGGAAAPNLAGYDHYEGVKANLGNDEIDYFVWEKIANGSEFTTGGYITSDTVDDAIDWVAAVPEPWFCLVNFNAPHLPYHAPPSSLHSVDLANAGPPKVDRRPYYKAMIEAMDTEIGRLLGTLGSARERTTILFAGDNGTPDGVIAPPLDALHAKGTVFEGGVNVPFIVDGPDVLEGGEADALVQFTDVFVTFLDIAVGIPQPGGSAGPFENGSQVPLTGLPFQLPPDSLSFRSVLSDPKRRGMRTTSYAVSFFPNGSTPTVSRRGARTRDYKLIINQGQQDPPLPEGVFFYDLKADPTETTNLLDQALSPFEQREFGDLMTTVRDQAF